MALRRRLMSIMAEAKNVVSGSITLDADARYIYLPTISFTPKMAYVMLREMPSSQTSYRTFYALYTFGHTDGISWTGNTPNKYYTLDGYYGQSGGRTVYQDIILTTTPVFPARSNSIPWCAGTYDYIIAG